MTKLCRLNQDNPHFSAFERHADWLQANCPGFVKNLKIYIFERTGLSGVSCWKKLSWWVENCPADHLGTWEELLQEYINKAVANFIKRWLWLPSMAVTSSICSNSVHLQVCILLSSPTNRLFSQPSTDYRWRLRLER